ncbi:FMN-binding negative transcriptional regulator [Mesorhizobium atlanticum]
MRRGWRVLVTATAEGPLATPLPLFLDESEGEHGVIYGHVAKANPHWRVPPLGDALAMFMGPDAYVTPALVPNQAGDREGGADMELRRRPRSRADRILRGRRPAARGGDAPDQSA